MRIGKERSRFPAWSSWKTNSWKKPDHFRVVFLPRIEVLGDAMRDLGDFLSRYRQA